MNSNLHNIQLDKKSYAISERLRDCDEALLFLTFREKLFKQESNRNFGKVVYSIKN